MDRTAEENFDADAELFASHGGLMLHDLHPLIARAADPHWADMHYAAAVRAAWFALRDELREKLNVELDGTELVEAIGESRQPRLLLTDFSNKTEQSMHRGLVRLLAGIALYVRNPMAHESALPHRDDAIRCFEYLALMSLCARHVAAAIQPMTVEEVVREASQPMFPTDPDSIADLVKALPPAHLPALVTAIVNELVNGDDAVRAVAARTLPLVYFQALAGHDADALVVRTAARLCGKLIADDDTLDGGMALVTADVYRLLQPRHRAKVAQALLRDSTEGRAGQGRFESGGRYVVPLSHIFPALSPSDRSKIVAAIQESFAGPSNAQRYAIGVVSLLSEWLREEERHALAARMAIALVRSSAKDGLFRTSQMVLARMDVAMAVDLQAALRMALGNADLGPPRDVQAFVGFFTRLDHDIRLKLGIA